MREEELIEDYDSEPVIYCARCYSLKIKHEDSIGADVCTECGCSDTLTSSIEDWERLYERRYGHKFTVKNEDPKTSFIFKLPLEKLKDKVYESSAWREIIKALYPGFPGGLGRADSIILFFDKLVKDSRIADLKLLLLKRINSKKHKNGRESEKQSGERGK